MTLGQKIQTLRHNAGPSQEGLGEKLGVSRQAISKWEADGAVPEVDKLIALSRLFEVNLHDLLQVEGTSREEPEDSEEQDPPAQPPEEEPKSPEEKDEPPRRNGRWWKALCVVLAAAVCIQGVALFRMNERLEEQEGLLGGLQSTSWSLESQVNSLDSQMSSQVERIDQLERAENEQELGVSTADGLVADFHYTMETTKYGSMNLKVTLLPTQSTSGGKINFQLTGADGTARTLPATQVENGSAYTLSIICSEAEVANGFTLSAVLPLNGKQYTQSLVRFSDITAYSWKAEELWEE